MADDTALTRSRGAPDADALVTAFLMRFLGVLAVLSVVANLGLWIWAATR